jgi:hypothetical protein
MLGVDTARRLDFKQWSEGKNADVQPATHARAGGHPGILRHGSTSRSCLPSERPVNRHSMNQVLVKTQSGWKVASILPIPVPTPTK